jgi:hypothetical protein
LSSPLKGKFGLFNDAARFAVPETAGSGGQAFFNHTKNRVSSHADWRRVW